MQAVSDARSRLMSRVGAKDTRPELIVRRLLHAMGYRFRLHRRDLPGRPDVVLPRLRTVVFVHGCFWHRHRGCRKTTTPKHNRAFWQDKFRANQSRDRRNIRALRRDGWNVLVVWECETDDVERLASRLDAELHVSAAQNDADDRTTDARKCSPR